MDCSGALIAVEREIESGWILASQTRNRSHVVVEA